MSASNCYHILTGEYPPQLGGVSDYTKHLAEGLVRYGKDVHIWTVPTSSETPYSKGVTVHRVAGHWSQDDLQHLNKALDQFPAPRLLLVQYVFNVWGYKGLNFGFGRWLLERCRQGDDVQMMVHEPFYLWTLMDNPIRWMLPVIQRLMMRTLLTACSKVYLSIPGWEKMLRPYETNKAKPMVWLPIPSNIPMITNQPKLEALRQSLRLEEKKVIGTFSICGEGKELARLLPDLLLHESDRIGLLFGRNSETFAAALIAKNPQLKSRVIALGVLSPEQISLHLQLCDVLIQPYVDGVSSRRTSAMAGLCHGKPVVTNKGAATEPIWSQTKCVALAESKTPLAVIQIVEYLLRDEDARRQLGATALLTYNKHFEWNKTLMRLLM